MECFIGIDVGTTHIKAGVINKKGQLLEVYREQTPAHQKQENEYYDPAELSTLVQSLINRALNEYGEISGIGITGMAESGLMIRKSDMKPLTDIFPWFDKRTVSMAEYLSKEEEQEAFYKTGLRNSYKYGIYKYLWSLKQEKIKAEDTVWLSICDFICFELTGEVVTDPTFAARTYVYDIRQKKWDTERIEKLGLKENNFPKVISSGEYIGYLHNTKIPVAICGHDHLCSTYGLIEKKEEICNSCGTAETFVGIFESLPKREAAFHSGLVFGPFVDGKNYFGMANLSSSGQSMEWFRTRLSDTEISYERINELLNSLPKGPGDIIYLPYLSGMGSPYFDTQATGALLGLRASHSAADVIKGIIEGVCYQGKWVLESGFGSQNIRIIATGGSTASNWWMQCKADILNQPVCVSTVTEGTLLGAVTLMLEKNEGFYIPFLTKIQQEFLPDFERAEAYRKKYSSNFIPYATANRGAGIKGKKKETREEL